MPTLETTVNGIKFPNPFVIGSGPPGTNARVICRSFADGWGASCAKTVSLDASKVINVAPRYGRLKDSSGEPYGWENIELISTMSFDQWIDEYKRVKDAYPDNVLIASIMEEFNKDAWFEIIERCEAAGVDMFECNFSCPHGLPERKMGAAMGENPDILSEVCDWVRAATTKPVWAKMTPNRPLAGLPRRGPRWYHCDQYHPKRHRSRLGNAATDAHGRRLHDTGRLFL